MSFLSYVSASAVAVGGLFVAGNSYALQLQCASSGYVLVVDNVWNTYGSYNVTCSNSYAYETFDFGVQPYSTYNVWGTLHGNVMCTLTGATSSTVAGYCP